MLSDLMARAKDLDPRLLRLGFIFCLLGYGTKAGIFPLHNWLPDAHSESPSPVSAMLSGALLNCALVAIWRLSQVMVAAGQAELVRQLLVPAGAITVIAASLMLVRQHDLKRMLAYSSVEHVGLLTLAIGIGSGQLFILHAFNHSIVKVALFLMAGGILHVYGTKELSKLGGILKASPVWGIVLIAAGFAIAGSPPFGTFISEWLLLRDTFASGEIVAAIVMIVGLTITFIAIATHVGRVVFGHERSPARTAPVRVWALTPALLLVMSLIAGVAVAPPVMRMLTVLAQTGGAAMNQISRNFKRISETPNALAATVRNWLQQPGRRFGHLTARVCDGNTLAIQVLLLDTHANGGVIITAPLADGEMEYPSVTAGVPAAHWAERAMGDFFGLRALEHPRWKTLILHDGAWPNDLFPLSPTSRGHREPYQFLEVQAKVFTRFRLGRYMRGSSSLGISGSVALVRS